MSSENLRSLKWRLAQTLEREENKNLRESVVDSKNLKYIQMRAQLIESILGYFVPINESIRILEIGGAGMPSVDHFRFGQKHSMDPLEDLYEEQYHEALGVNAFKIRAIAENIPYQNNSFDAIVMLNVIDHCINPEVVIKECARILRHSGVILVSVNTTSPFFTNIKRIKRFFLKSQSDKMHPHFFSTEDIMKLMTMQFNPTYTFSTYIDVLAGESPVNSTVSSGFGGGLANHSRFYFIGSKY